MTDCQTVPSLGDDVTAEDIEAVYQAKASADRCYAEYELLRDALIARLGNRPVVIERGDVALELKDAEFSQLDRRAVLRRLKELGEDVTDKRWFRREANKRHMWLRKRVHGEWVRPSEYDNAVRWGGDE